MTERTEVIIHDGARITIEPIDGGADHDAERVADLVARLLADEAEKQSR
jgi:hypothetical protein